MSRLRRRTAPRVHERGTSCDSLGCKDRRAQLFWSYLTDEVLFLTRSEDKPRWGQPPWRIDFEAEARPLPEEVDVAIIGGGFTGLAVAAWLGRLPPEKAVAVLEAHRLGAGASGRSGGLALGGTAAGDLPGLGDVLGGFTDILCELEIDCDQRLPGVWEVGHSNTSPDSPIEWRESGAFRIVGGVPGGAGDPGKLGSGLGRAAQRPGGVIAEHSPVSGITFNDPGELSLARLDRRQRGRACRVAGESRAARARPSSNLARRRVLPSLGRTNPDRRVLATRLRPPPSLPPSAHPRRLQRTRRRPVGLPRTLGRRSPARTERTARLGQA